MRKCAGLLFLLLLGGCGGSQSSGLGAPAPGAGGGAAAKRGDVVSYTLIRDYGELSMDIVLDKIEEESGISMSVTSDVSLYKVVYWTVDLKGKLVQATGAVAIPDTPTNPALVSYQHSTVTDKSNVPSQNNDEAWAVLAIFAATGNYVVSMADYLGLGGSPGLHPYMSAESEATASLDMMRASRSVCNAVSVSLAKKSFLSGYSQGGHATMALARLIESTALSEFPLSGVAPGDGPYDLSDTELHFAFNQPGPDTSVFLAYLVLAYREYFGILPNLKDVFVSPWDTRIESLFDGTHDISDIADTIPHQLTDLFTTDFINNTLHQTGNALVAKLKENDAWQWLPKTHVTFYHAKSDNIVAYANAQKAYNYMHAAGSDVTLVDTATGIDHETGFFYAIPDARLWFDTLTTD